MSAPNASDALLDAAREVRKGEELDEAALEAFLARELPALAGPLRVTQFPGGHSNLTYLVETPSRAFILRRPPFGAKIKTAHDMGREHRILSRLSRVYPRAPAPLAYCEDESVLGAPFYLMERTRGIVLRRALPEGLDFSPERARRLSENFVDALAELHALDYEAAGLGDLGRPEGYVARQVSGWTKRYEAAKTDEIPEVEEIARWLAERIPEPRGACLIHNDFKYDNLVLDPADPTRITGVLDWEMSTLGDPLMDLGTSLGYWVQASDADELKAFAFGPTYVPGTLSRRELAARYFEKTGREPVDMVFYYCFALFKTSVVAQQIYARFAAGHSKDPRFAAMIWGVRILSRLATEAASRGSSD